MKLLIPLFTSVAVFLSSCTATGPVACNVDIESPSSPAKLDSTRLDDVPRSNDDREAAAWRLLEAAQCDQVYKEAVPRTAKSNLVCEIKGQLGDYILVGAHHDRLGLGEGAADNWTGILILSSLASHYSTHPPIHSMRFVAFAEEESDLLGSTHHVRSIREHPPRVMMNVDTIGVSTLSLDGRAEPGLNCLAAQVAEQMDIEIRTTLIRDMTGDWQPFHRAGIPVVTFHSVDRWEMQKLHSWYDKSTLVDQDRFRAGFRVVAETLSAIDHGIDLTIEKNSGP